MGNEPQVKDAPAVEAPSSSAPVAEKTETSFFAPGKIAKWAEQSGLFTEPKAEAPKPKEPEAKPVPPEKDGEGTTPKTEAAEPAKPFKVIEVDGRKVEIKSEEELLDLAKKSLHGEQSGAGRPDVTQGLDRLIAALEKRMASPEVPKEEPANMIGDVDLDLLDPSLAKVLKDTQLRNDRLEKTLELTTDYVKTKKFEEASAEVERIIQNVRKDAPFTDFTDKELGRNVTQDLFTGTIAALVNEDRAMNRPLKKVEDYMKSAAQTISRFEKHVKGQAEKLTATLVADKYPDVLKEIQETAVANYLREKGDEAPTPRSGRAEPVPHGSDTKAKNRGLSESLRAGLNDPVIEAGFEEAARQGRRPQ